MFKLIKILNSGTSTPEPVYLKKKDGVKYSIASPLVIRVGEADNAAVGDRPTHISAECGEERSDKLLAFRISPDMVFETVITESPVGLAVGDRVKLAVGDDGVAYGVGAVSEDGAAEITDFGAGNTVTVVFHQ